MSLNRWQDKAKGAEVKGQRLLRKTKERKRDERT